ncbi:MAG: hypothetical protein M1828_003462 [Chrysothrix sp. TS-e1954]|nr:MAG: hypothetical protein M1828_003462 [Chrysothrix sp. TS-e1954]
MPLLTLPTTPHQQIHYADLPPTSTSPHTTTTKPPILLLHGLGSSQNYWLALTPHLTSRGHRCIALDTPGSARSPLPPSSPQPTVSSLATTFLDFLSALDINKAVLIGHSMSAGLTVPAMAASAPDRVLAAVLIGPVYPTRELAPVFEDRIAKVRGEGGMQTMADSIPYAALGSKAGHLPRAMVRELLLNQSVEGYVANCKVIAGAWRGREGVEGGERPVPEYEAVRAPVLVIAGEEDGSAPVGGCVRMLREMGMLEEGVGKRLVVLQGRGHWQCVECPEEVAGECVKFLEEQGL